jgi:hypothetical protein
VLKWSAGALYDWMWGPHGRDTVRERSYRALEKVCDVCVRVFYMDIIYFVMFL